MFTRSLFMIIWSCLRACTCFANKHEHHSHYHSSDPRVFLAKNHFTANTIAQNPLLFDKLESYIERHGAITVLNDTNICKRRFVIATFACPQNIGNHMHEFMNNVMGAFIQDRTVVWRYCTRKPCQLDNEQDCEDHFHRLPWMASLWDVEQKWKEQGCDQEQLNYGWPLLIQKFRFQAQKILMCCGIDFLEQQFLDYGTHDLREFESLSLPQARLIPSSRRRAKLLFAMGEDFAYGVILRMTFQFQPHIVSTNDITLATSLRDLHEKYETLYGPDIEVQPFYIGLHLRHSNNADQSGKSNGEKRCVDLIVEDQGHLNLHRYHDQSHIVGDRDRRQLEQIEIAARAATEVMQSSIENSLKMQKEKKITIRPCVILFASDRKEQIDQALTRKHLFNCSVVVSNHSLLPEYFVVNYEHGPYSGLVSMLDLELLARSDLFVGSSYMTGDLIQYASTFSLLIAELRATSGNILSLKHQAYFIPECGQVLGAKREIDSIHKEQFFCGNNELVDPPILLPLHCRYWNKTDSDFPTLSKEPLWNDTSLRYYYPGAE